MAEPITIQKLIEASMDSDSLEVLVNGDENAQVTTRLGETYPSAKKAIKTLFENGGLPATPFATKTLMEASALVDGQHAMVTDDTDNNGLYVKTAGTWVKSAYDPTALAKTYSDTRNAATLQAAKDYALDKSAITFNNKFTSLANIVAQDAPSGWSPRFSALSVVDENLVITGDGTKVLVGARHVGKIKLARKVLVKARFKVNNPDCEYLSFGNDGSVAVKVHNLVMDEWMEVNEILTSTGGTNDFYIYSVYPSAEVAKNKSITIDYIELIVFEDAGLINHKLRDSALRDLMDGYSAPYRVDTQFLMQYLAQQEEIVPPAPLPPTEGAQPPQDLGLTLDAGILKSSSDIEIYNPDTPDLKPLSIRNSGLPRPDYDYSPDYLKFNTEIARVAWGMQITMNGKRYPDLNGGRPIKDNKDANAIVLEWGVEGLSTHVSPKGLEWGNRDWMVHRIGGEYARSNSNHPNRFGGKIQSFLPAWTERSDSASGKGWTEASDNHTNDNKIPTHTMLRESVSFESPDYYRAAYSNQQTATWDNYHRVRGTIANPEVTQHGDVIHQHIYSATKSITTGLNPRIDDVAMVEFVYNDDPASDDEAKIVFKVKSRSTGEWLEKLVI